MGVQICSCNKDPGHIAVPYSDFSLENNNNYKKQQKFINNQKKLNKDSICLPNGNNINSFFESKEQNNQNDIDHFDISLSPIANARKNININIININNESSNLRNNSSNNNNISSFNNINNTDKFDQIKFANDKDIVKEESCESNSQENDYDNDNENDNENEENENDSDNDNENKSKKEDSKVEENRKILIEQFDKKIKEFADYISDDKLNEKENSAIKKLEETLDEISFDWNNNPKCFSRPALFFKNDNYIYKGSWNSKGLKEGFGTFLDSEGNKYIGEWKDDKFNGKGRLFSIYGDYYEGYFCDGVIEGNGLYYSKMNGYKYFGQFKNNKFHGKGKLEYDNKIIYEGNFAEGYKEGLGQLTFGDGAYYKGNFVKNNFNGNGKFVFKDGRNYSGDWKNNVMDGRGTFNWGNECKYVGDYKNNKREGNGVYSFGCNLYDGNWLNNMPHGEGTLLHDGIKIVGHFRYGKILEMVEGKGVNREMTQKLTIDSKINTKILEDSNKIDISLGETDSRNIKTEKFMSENLNGNEKRNRSNENKNNLSRYNKQNKKNKIKNKDKDK